MSLTTTPDVSYISFDKLQNLPLFKSSPDHKIQFDDKLPGAVRYKLLSLLGLSGEYEIRPYRLVARGLGTLVATIKHRADRYNSWNRGWTPDDGEIRAGSLVPVVVPKGNPTGRDVEIPKVDKFPFATIKNVRLLPRKGHSSAYHHPYWGGDDELFSGKNFRCLVTVSTGTQLPSESALDLEAPSVTDGKDITFIMRIPVAEEIFKISFVRKDKEISIKLGNGQEFPVSPDFCNHLLASINNLYYEQAPLFSEIRNAGNHTTLLGYYLDTQSGTKAPPSLKGIQKTWKKISPLCDEVAKKSPATYMAFRRFAGQASRSVDGVRVSVVFNQALKDVTTADQFIVALKPMTEATVLHRRGFDESIKKMPQYIEKRKASLKSQTKRAHSKLMQDMEFINIDEKLYPLTHKAVTEGTIPLSTFFMKKEQYFLFNNNWALWEEMLSRYPDVTVALAKEVCTRKNYAKDLMSYFFHVLHDLPEYLEKHTGRKWTGIPKLLNDSSALDSSRMATGVSKERSAMTPIVDNDKNTVTVPFVSVYMPGRFGVYCYAHQYTVLRRGVMHDGSAVTKDIEEKLNGRDDYGLMFYTLIGTSRGNGYPAFLIIFERLHSTTRVHIHRVNPCRSKDGDKLAIHDWTKNCYNWMAGNVRADRIKTSQGDLMFVEVEDDIKREFTKEVNNFDSHAFDKAVAFCEKVPKTQKNLLGYCQLQADTWLRHPEHEDRLLEMGLYEIRQARSYENNPAGSWSLTID